MGEPILPLTCQIARTWTKHALILFTFCSIYQSSICEQPGALHFFVVVYPKCAKVSFLYHGYCFPVISYDVNADTIPPWLYIYMWTWTSFMIGSHLPLEDHKKDFFFFLEHAQKRLLDVYWQAIRFATWYKTLAVNNLFGKQLQGIRLLLSIIRSQKIPLDCIYLFHGQPSFWKKKIARNLSTLKSYLHHSWVLLKK